MASLTVTIAPATARQPRRVRVEMDANRLEQLAASFGLYNLDFIASLERAERDVRAGRTRKIRSLKELRT